MLTFIRFLTRGLGARDRSLQPLIPRRVNRPGGGPAVPLPAAGRPAWLLHAGLMSVAVLAALVWIIRDLTRHGGRPADLPDLAETPAVVVDSPFDHARWGALPAPEALAAVTDLIERCAGDAVAQAATIARSSDAGLVVAVRAARADVPQPPEAYQACWSSELSLGCVGQGRLVAVTATVRDLRQGPIDGVDAARLGLELNGSGDPLLAAALSTALPAGLAVGDRLRLTGRQVGLVERSAWGLVGSRPVPVLAVHRLVPAVSEDLAATLGLQAATPLELQPGSDLWSGIDDVAPGVEKRPYYRLLGAVARDLDAAKTAPASVSAPVPAARDGMALAQELHGNPAAYRGERVTVEGAVWDVTDDREVGCDRPFGIGRTVRIRLYKQIGGLPRPQFDAEGRPLPRASGLHGFEIDIPDCGQIGRLPVRGEGVRATGHFLKVRGYPYYRGDGREAAYFKMVVAPEFTILPPAAIYTTGVFGWSLFAFGLGIILYIGYLMWREDRSQSAQRAFNLLRSSHRTREKDVRPPPQA